MLVAPMVSSTLHLVGWAMGYASREEAHRPALEIEWVAPPGCPAAAEAETSVAVMCLE
jgi:hypothetical protein